MKKQSGFGIFEPMAIIALMGILLATYVESSHSAKNSADEPHKELRKGPKGGARG